MGTDIALINTNMALLVGAFIIGWYAYAYLPRKMWAFVLMVISVSFSILNGSNGCALIAVIIYVLYDKYSQGSMVEGMNNNSSNNSSKEVNICDDYGVDKISLENCLKSKASNSIPVTNSVTKDEPSPAGAETFNTSLGQFGGNFEST